MNNSETSTTNSLPEPGDCRDGQMPESTFLSLKTAAPFPISAALSKSWTGANRKHSKK